MTNSAAVNFYSAIRKDAAVIAHLAGAENEENLIARIDAEATKRGISLSESDIRQGFDHLDEVIRQSAGESELTDKELEIVSGGTSFSAFVEYGHNETRGKKWGSYETVGNNVYYFNSTGCRTSKEEFMQRNA